MASRLDIERKGSGNPALDSTFLGPLKERLLLGKSHLTPFLKNEGEVVLARLGYLPDEAEYLKSMFPLLTYHSREEREGQSVSYRDPVDSTSSRRSIFMESPRAGVVALVFNKANERYSAVHPQEEESVAKLKGILDDQSGDLAIGKLFVLDQTIFADDLEMRKLLRGEFAASRIIGSKTPLASLVRSARLAATDTFIRDQTGLTSDLQMEVQFPGGKSSKHVWRNVGATHEAVILGRAIRTNIPDQQ